MDAKILGPIGGNGGGGSDLLTGALLGSLNGNNNGGILSGNGNGLGAGLVGFLIGAMVNNGGNGLNLFGGGNNQAAQQQAQDFILEAISHQGQRQTDAIANLANTLNADFNLVYNTFMGVKDQLTAMAGNMQLGQCQTQGTIQNTGNSIIQAGQANTQAITQQLYNQFSQQQMSDCQGRRDIIDAINDNGRATLAKMDAIEDARKDREIAELQRKLAESENQKFIAGYVSQALAPVIGGLNAVSQKVSDICCKLPETVTLPYSGLTVVPNWQAQIGYDIAGSAIANRFFPSQADAAAGGTAGGGTATQGQ